MSDCTSQSEKAHTNGFRVSLQGVEQFVREGREEYSFDGTMVRLFEGTMVRGAWS